MVSVLSRASVSAVQPTLTPVAVGLDVGVARRGAVLDEGVVIRDVGRLGVALRGGEEHDPEGVAGAEAGGNQAPVLGHFGSSAGAGDVGGGSGAGGVDGGDAVVARVAGGEAGLGVGGGCGAGVGDEIGPGRSAVGGDLDPVAADGGAAGAGRGGSGQVDLGRPVGGGCEGCGGARHRGLRLRHRGQGKERGEGREQDSRQAAHHE